MGNTFILLLVKGVMIGSIYALISLGFNVIYRTTGVLNFCQGEFVMIGGVVAAWAASSGSLPLWGALAVGVLAAALTGVLVDLLAIRPVRRAAPVIHIMITVGVSIILRAGVSLVWGTEPFHLPPIQTGAVACAGVAVQYQDLWILGTAALCMGLLSLFFRYARTGRAMEACAENAPAASLCGVSPGRMSALAFGLSAGLAGIAGVLLTPMLSMSYDRGTWLGLKGFAASILGGLGNPIGGVVGGLLLGVLEQYSCWFSSVYKETLAFALVVIVLLVRPRGLLTR